MAKFQCNFLSYTLERAVDITVIIPSPVCGDCMEKTAVHTPREDYPVLYLLHGYANNHATWTGYTNVELFAEERQIAVVMLSAENKSYVSVGSDDFFTYVSKELPDFVTGMFPISKKPADTYIAGLSMGGYGALVHGLSAPARFAAIGAFSAGVDINPTQLAKGIHGDPQTAPDICNPRKLAAARAAEGVPLPKLYLACGEQDFLYGDNLSFHEQLTGLGIDHTWVTHPTYSHEWRFWNEQAEAFLDWIPRSDSYAGSRRQV